MTNKKLINTTGTVVVNTNSERAFDFFANPSNDNLWRTEINKATLDGNLQLGVLVSEYSNLSKKASNDLIELRCVKYEHNKLAIFETPENAQFYQRSHRQIEAISDKTTKIIYSLDFDINIVKHALGFALPKFIVSFKAKSDLKKYLQQLKTILENSI